MPEDKKDQVEVLRSMLIEVAAESSEELMEKFFNDEELTEEEIYDGLQVGIANHSIAPVMCGSATLGYGVKLLMNTIVRFTLPAIEAKAIFPCPSMTGRTLFIAPPMTNASLRMYSKPLPTPISAA